MGPSVSFPLPPRIAKKLPTRNCWELLIGKLPIPLPMFFFFELIIEGAQTVKCKPWTERVAEKGLSRGVSRAAGKRRINRELEAKKAHKPWIREGLNREVQTVN